VEQSGKKNSKFLQGLSAAAKDARSSKQNLAEIEKAEEGSE